MMQTRSKFRLYVSPRGPRYLSVLRTPIALPPSSNGKEQRMINVPRAKHEKTFQQRVAEEALRSEKLPINCRPERPGNYSCGEFDRRRPLLKLMVG